MFTDLQNPCYLHKRDEFCLNTVCQLLRKLCQQGFINPEFFQFLQRQRLLKISSKVLYLGNMTDKTLLRQKVSICILDGGSTIISLSHPFRELQRCIQHSSAEHPKADVQDKQCIISVVSPTALAVINALYNLYIFTFSVHKACFYYQKCHCMSMLCSTEKKTQNMKGEETFLHRKGEIPHPYSVLK